ncbi:MAG: hypothetical protein HQL31_04360, partial [Planctomycetes bacterium]|nr:hypothetical protein [Planctomycetota bacterium]
MNDKIDTALLIAGHPDTTGMANAIAGFDISTAADGSEALSLAAQKKYCAVLLDLPLPEVLDTARKLKALDPDAPFILALFDGLTAEGLEAGFSAGITDFLPRPISGPLLKYRLDLLLELTRLRKGSLRREKDFLNLKQRLHDSTEELRQFTHVASHDLKDPLHLIMGFTEVLRTQIECGNFGRAPEVMAKIEKGVQRMRTLIDDLLMLSRANCERLEFEPVNLRAILLNAVTSQTNLLQELGGKIDTGAIPDIVADRALMSQLFKSLVDNAVKFRRAELPPLIKISARTVDHCLEDSRIPVVAT